MTIKRQDMLLILFAALVLAVGHFYTVTPTCFLTEMDCFDQSNPFTALAPFRYRILAPALRWLLLPNPTPIQAIVVDALLHGACVAVFLPALYLWLYRWLSASRALVGVLVTTVALMLMFNYYAVFGTSIIEAALLVLALVILDRSRGVYAALVILASLNRETSLLLVALYAVWHGRSAWRSALGLLLLWAAITAGIHLYMGGAAHSLGLLGTLETNIDMIGRAILLNAPFVVLWGMALARYRSSPPVLKRFMWVAALYGGSVIVGATWAEVRVLLPLFPLLLPIILRETSVPAVI